MADIYCRTCGEPWDADELHEVGRENDRSWSEMIDLFLRNGCAVFDTRCRTSSQADGPSVIGEVFAILAELGDFDGAIAEIEDARALGWFE